LAYLQLFIEERASNEQSFFFNDTYISTLIIYTGIVMDIQEQIRKANVAIKELNDNELIDAGIYNPDDFFIPVITYPAMSTIPFATENELLPSGKEPQLPVAVYIHIPFCITRCLFCHWVIKLNSKEDEMSKYLDCLELELKRYKLKYRISGKIPATSILVGGGTPTLLPPKHMKKFFEIVHRHIDMNEVLQFSYEGEPSTLLGDIGAERLTLMNEYGVNRVSYGVQAFHDPLLKRNGRHHNSAQALEAIERSHLFGIKSVSIDLIYGLTGQTVEDWISTMNTAVRSGADAWQLYRLRIVPHGDRPGTVTKHSQKKPEQYSKVKQTILMKMLGIQISEENGFPQRYTRIFARNSDDISFYLHDVNSKLRDVISIGISSWGNVGDTYLLNVGNNFQKYYRLIEEGGLPIDRGLRRDKENEARHCFILQLKNTRVDKELFRKKMTVSPNAVFGETIDQMKQYNLLQEDDQFLWLTKRGRFYADQVVAQFATAKYKPKPIPRPVTLGVKET